jgi:hypothetical protein
MFGLEFFWPIFFCSLCREEFFSDGSFDETPFKAAATADLVDSLSSCVVCASENGVTK